MPANSSGDGGAAATAMAAAAAVMAQQAADEAHRARCQVVLDHDPRGSVQDMQAFGSCVAFVYPESGPATRGDKILYGSAGLVFAICIIVGAVWMGRLHDDDLGDMVIGGLIGALFGAIAGGCIAALVLGAAALVQFLLS